MFPLSLHADQNQLKANDKKDKRKVCTVEVAKKARRIATLRDMKMTAEEQAAIDAMTKQERVAAEKEFVSLLMKENDLAKEANKANLKLCKVALTDLPAAKLLKAKLAYNEAKTKKAATNLMEARKYQRISRQEASACKEPKEG